MWHCCRINYPAFIYLLDQASKCLIAAACLLLFDIRSVSAFCDVPASLLSGSSQPASRNLLAAGKSPAFGVSLIARSVLPGLTSRETQPTNFQGQDQDQTDQALRLIDGLRQRRLFDLAEIYCNQCLAGANINNEQLALFTLELIKTQTSRALLASPGDRDQFWQQAHQTATRFSQQYPEHPREILIGLQRGLIYLAQGQLIQQEIEGELISFAEQEQATENALVQLRAANLVFEELERSITRQIPLQRNRNLQPGELTVEELLQLSQQVRLQLATVNLQRAKWYAADDRLNRVDALNRVLDRLQEIQKGTSPNQPIWWENQTLLVEVYRLLGQINNAEQVIQRANAFDETEEYSNPIQAKWIEQLIRLALDKGDLESLTQAVYTSEQIPNRQPQLDLARLLAVREFSQRSTGDDRTLWLQKAANLAREIEAQHGGYWGRRAKLILIAGADSRMLGQGDPGTTAKESRSMSADRQAGGAEIDLLVGLAEQALRQERFEDAYKAYHRASQLALELQEAGNDLALSLALQAGQSLEKTGQHQTVANYLLQLAVENSQHRLGSATHLRGLWNQGRAIGFVPTAGESIASQRQRNDFLRGLQQHLTIWQTASSRNQIRYWLGNHYLATANLASNEPTDPANIGGTPTSQDVQLRLRNWQLSIENYLAIEIGTPLFEDSIRRSAYAARQWIHSAPQAERSPFAERMTTKWKTLLNAANRQQDPVSDADVTEVADNVDVTKSAGAGWQKWKLTVSLIIAEFGLEQGTISIDELVNLLIDGLPNPAQLAELENGNGSSTSAESAADILRAKSWLWAGLAWSGGANQKQGAWQIDELLNQISTEVTALATAERAFTEMAQHQPAARSDSSYRERLKLIENALARHHESMDEHERIAWQFRQADNLIELQRFDAAIPILTELEKLRPQDAAIQLRLARVTTELQKETTPDQPLRRWQRLASQLRPHTDGWYEAKYQIAWLLEYTGQRAEARKSLEYLQAIPPGWENSKLRNQFESLLRRCQQ